jgi:branched-chain amino acid transport system substrate-binding protein
MLSVRRLLFAVFSAALVFGGTAAPSRSADPPIQIDVILPLTGQAAFIGKEHQASLAALEAAVNKKGGIRGRQVNFIFHDDQSNPQVAVQLANQAIAKKPPIVLGSSLSAFCRAMAPLFANGPVMYCLSPAIYPAKGSYVIAANVPTRDLILAYLRYFRDKGWKRVARITTTDASGQDADDHFRTLMQLLEFKDMTIVADEHMAVNDTSVTAQAARIKAANPQAIVAWTPGTPLGTALRAFNDVGLDNVPTATSSANMVASQIKSYSGFLPKEFLFTGGGFQANISRNGQMKAAESFFADALKSAGIQQIDFQSGMAYDPALITLSAFEKLGPNPTPEQVRSYILGLKSFPGVNGLYDFSNGEQHGLTASDVLIFRWNPSKTWWDVVSGFGGTPK